MEEELIDLIYQNEEVEGLAVFSASGQIIENQLALTEDSVVVVSKTISQIASALGEAGRNLKGFLLKSKQITLQICVFDHMILLIQLAEPFSANKVERSIRSIIGNSAESLAYEAAKEEPKLAVAEPVTANVTEMIEFEGFSTKLTQLITRVAPSGVAEKMIRDVFKAEGIDTALPTIEKAKAIALGEKVVAKIPNPSRRKLIAKEYALIIKTF